MANFLIVQPEIAYLKIDGQVIESTSPADGCLFRSFWKELTDETAEQITSLLVTAHYEVNHARW